jgi:hypothetical protein
MPQLPAVFQYGCLNDSLTPFRERDSSFRPEFSFSFFPVREENIRRQA